MTTTHTATYTCPTCGAKSHNPVDRAEGYCGWCHDYTGPSEEDRLPMVAVYFNPSDYPGRFIARRFWVAGGVITAEMDPIAVGQSLAAVQECIPPGMTRLSPLPGDENTIVETWL